MNSTLLLIDLLGAAALLLWGLRLLKSGVNVAFGAQLRHFLSASTRNRFSAFGAGLVTTLALQSSTAMAVVISSFVAQELVAPMMAQAVMLGANVGTALVAQILAFDLHWLAPVLILIGVTVGSRKSRRSRGLSEIAVAIGLMLLSLRLMNEATGPMRDSTAVAAFFSLLGNAPIVAVAMAATLAALSASSLAVVLFIMSLAVAGGIDAQLCLLLVAGANVGGAMPPVMAAAAEGIVARRVAVSNLTVRLFGALVVLLASARIVGLFPTGIDLAQLTVQAHLGFNIGLAILFLPLIGPLTRMMAHFLPGDTSAGKPPVTQHLDEAALSDPLAALASGMRETLRVGDLVEQMLDMTLIALKSNDEELCRKVLKLDDEVDAAVRAIKLYLARVDAAKLDEGSRHQLNAVMDYAINLEHVGDIVDSSLSRLTIKKIENQLQYSPEGMREIEELFSDTIDNLRLAQNVFINRDPQIARRLMEGKVSIRRKERRSVERHLARLQKRYPDTLQTTSLHVDVVRDLKRINSHLTSVAAPILEEAGMLRESRLRKA
ncbi:Na/Pi cotransporter family protein [Notoacmeibacter sp. MSK16QG-6]|uniref:Na/Pi cotransporter family protein n=1 Tax=Notoacmeibacter sp. MSK16QG-6 TaxID=2957982 RepID=UPI0020A0EDAA|nr:Na/Pi cotransporter family protein [Notoacmeibacter sp. MSK16QG-6]MCP1200978.1 Na/Pi cotransporter family protein [Notoacmeibacter sp. MSK16QG-6]